MSRVQRVGIVVAMCVCVTIGGCIQDSIFVKYCDEIGVYVPVTNNDILIECYTVEHTNNALS